MHEHEARGGGTADRLLVALPPLIWGSTYIVTTRYLPAERPLTIAMLRALPPGLLLLAVTRCLPKGEWWWRATVLGGLNIGIFLAMLFVAATRLPGGVAATVLSSQPLIVLLLLRILFNERPGFISVLGASLGLLGIALLVTSAGARLDAIGIVAGLVGALSMAAGSVLTMRWKAPVPPLTLTAWQLCAGGAMLIPPALLAEGLPVALTLPAAGALAYLGIVGGALAYAIWFGGLRRLDAAQVSALSLLSPICATLLGWIVLDQKLTVIQLTGLAFAMLGIWLSQLRRHVPGQDR